MSRYIFQEQLTSALTKKCDGMTSNEVEDLLFGNENDIEALISILDEGLDRMILEGVFRYVLNSNDFPDIWEEISLGVIERTNLVADEQVVSSNSGNNSPSVVRLMKPGGVYEFLTNYIGVVVQEDHIDEMVMVMQDFPIDSFVEEDQVKVREYLSDLVSTFVYESDEVRDNLFKYLDDTFGCNLYEMRGRVISLEDIECCNSHYVLTARKLKKLISIFRSKGVDVTEREGKGSHIVLEFFGKCSISISRSGISADKYYVGYFLRDIKFFKEKDYIDYSPEEIGLLVEVFQEFNDKVGFEVFVINSDERVRKVS